MDRTIYDFVKALKEDIQSSLEVLGNLPKSDPFEHGVSVGVYQGQCKALETLEAIIADQVKQESQT